MAIAVEVACFLLTWMLQANPLVAAVLIFSPVTLRWSLCRRLLEREAAARRRPFLDGLHSVTLTYWFLRSSASDETTLWCLEYASVAALCYHEVLGNAFLPTLYIAMNRVTRHTPEGVYFRNDWPHPDGMIVHSCQGESCSTVLVLSVLGDVLMSNARYQLYRLEVRNVALIVSRSIDIRSLLGFVSVPTTQGSEDDEKKEWTAATELEENKLVRPTTSNVLLPLLSGGVVPYERFVKSRLIYLDSLLKYAAAETKKRLLQKCQMEVTQYSTDIRSMNVAPHLSSLFEEKLNEIQSNFMSEFVKSVDKISSQIQLKATEQMFHLNSDIVVNLVQQLETTELQMRSKWKSLCVDLDMLIYRIRFAKNRETPVRADSGLQNRTTKWKETREEKERRKLIEYLSRMLKELCSTAMNDLENQIQSSFKLYSKELVARNLHPGLSKQVNQKIRSARNRSMVKLEVYLRNTEMEVQELTVVENLREYEEYLKERLDLAVEYHAKMFIHALHRINSKLNSFQSSREVHTGSIQDANHQENKEEEEKKEKIEDISVIFNEMCSRATENLEKKLEYYIEIYVQHLPERVADPEMVDDIVEKVYSNKEPCLKQLETVLSGLEKDLQEVREDEIHEYREYLQEEAETAVLEVGQNFIFMLYEINVLLNDCVGGVSSCVPSGLRRLYCRLRRIFRCS